MFSLLIMNIMMFMFLQHPLLQGLALFIFNISAALMLGMLKLNFFYAYILFLIMIGGMMILFMYMTSIASNEKFKQNYLWLLPMIIIFLVNNNYYPNQMYSYVYYFNKMIILNNYLFIITVIFLLITMISIVKICSLYSSTLRQNI
uniref:NADH-ubiquinone oxidoreductase chain 6 n=1 Tax=Sphindus dubius TaxID=295944 RepID=A0A0S2MQM2_9CUCU|nr:NADH deshydrogenase subunit 6 [Sphindus dubius]